MTEFPCPGPVTVDLRLGGGVCEIRAEERDTAMVEVEPYDGTDAARQAARDIRVELSGDTLVIAAPEVGGWLFRRSPRLRVTAAVPAGSSGRLRVASADITCHGEWAQVKIYTASGDAHLEHVTGDLAVNSASGDVRAGQVGGRLTVNTASGDVSANRVGGPVEIKGASAGVDIDDLGADLRSTTASGDVRVGTARRGTVTVNSASGDVTIGVVTGTGVWLDLNTLSGRTSSDLNMSGDTPATGHDLTIQVRTMSGDIDVHRVPARTDA
jgi:DUF4097 and DUF4098 domain-containing protein YvlB